MAGGAGIGVRGPGEMRLEVQRRRLRQRASRLRADAAELARRPERVRRRRARNRVPSVAITGYANAGKSALLNRLTGAAALTEDVLFATPDPTVRRTAAAGNGVRPPKGGVPPTGARFAPGCVAARARRCRWSLAGRVCGSVSLGR